VTGIIDWGDACVGDPLDFAGFDETDRELLLASYDRPLDATWRKRVAIRRHKIRPYHAILYGIEQPETDWLTRALAALREGLQ
jgi:hypothetical protein